MLNWFYLNSFYNWNLTKVNQEQRHYVQTGGQTVEQRYVPGECCEVLRQTGVDRQWNRDMYQVNVVRYWEFDVSAGEIVYMYWFTIAREQIYCHHVRVKLLNIYTHTQTYSLSLSVSLQTGSLPMLIKDCISLEINFADTKSATGIKFLTFSTYKC